MHVNAELRNAIAQLIHQVTAEAKGRPGGTSPVPALTEQIVNICYMQKLAAIKATRESIEFMVRRMGVSANSRSDILAAVRGEEECLQNKISDEKALVTLRHLINEYTAGTYVSHPSYDEPAALRRAFECLSAWPLVSAKAAVYDAIHNAPRCACTGTPYGGCRPECPAVDNAEQLCLAKARVLAYGVNKGKR